MQYYFRLLKIKQLVLHINYRTWSSWLIFIVLLLSACKSIDISESESEFLATSSDLSPLLIWPEDMGWSSGYYDVDKEFYWPFFGSTPPEFVWNIKVSPIPGSGGGKYPITHDDMRSGHQIIVVFKDDVTARQEFEATITELNPIGQVDDQTLYDKLPNGRIDNSLARCDNFDWPNLGQLEACEVLMQLGPYLVSVSMNIDGNYTTNQDFVNMLEIVQERLIEHVAQNP